MLDLGHLAQMPVGGYHRQRPDFFASPYDYMRRNQRHGRRAAFSPMKAANLQRGRPGPFGRSSPWGRSTRGPRFMPFQRGLGSPRGPFYGRGQRSLFSSRSPRYASSFSSPMFGRGPLRSSPMSHFSTASPRSNWPSAPRGYPPRSYYQRDYSYGRSDDDYEDDDDDDIFEDDDEFGATDSEDDYDLDYNDRGYGGYHNAYYNQGSCYNPYSSYATEYDYNGGQDGFGCMSSGYSGYGRPYQHPYPGYSGC